MGFSLMNQPFWGAPDLGNPHMGTSWKIWDNLWEKYEENLWQMGFHGVRWMKRYFMDKLSVKNWIYDTMGNMTTSPQPGPK